MINPTLKIANFGPNNFVSPNETTANKIIPKDINKILLKEYLLHEKKSLTFRNNLY